MSIDLNPTNPGITELKELFESKINSLKEFTAMQFLTIEKTTETSRVSLDSRLASIEKTLDFVKNLTSAQITRAECTTISKSIEKDIDALKNFQATMEGKASQKSVDIVTMTSIIGLIIGLAGLAMNLLS